MKSISRLPRISKAEAVLILITMLWGGTFFTGTACADRQRPYEIGRAHV